MNPLRLESETIVSRLATAGPGSAWVVAGLAESAPGALGESLVTVTMGSSLRAGGGMAGRGGEIVARRNDRGPAGQSDRGLLVIEARVLVVHVAVRLPDGRRERRSTALDVVEVDGGDDPPRDA